MENKSNIKSIGHILPVLGLMLLLLLSPCKVRNYIQSELGITTTEASNKSKSTLGKSTCSDFEIAKMLPQYSKEKVAKDRLANAGMASFSPKLWASETDNKVFVSSETKAPLGTSVPLYILYRNFKNYL
ncbi:hypothetical protein [Mangrovimonas sp. DI 80]|uniref:hypothetical protein n=1 Tax=Mangrovimonas sp. DI 80 TaxID=1779330 RepID=UPI0009758135|nr:hypothetical protein [Mangrovimonas sp. DI 80]OMP30037.1 hypothetical protein BKM32_14240 [Mangrovimonas sp. DI 80]